VKLLIKSQHSRTICLQLKWANNVDLVDNDATSLSTLADTLYQETDPEMSIYGWPLAYQVITKALISWRPAL